MCAPACVSRAAAALQPVCACDRTRVNAETDVGKLALVEELKLKARKSIAHCPTQPSSPWPAL